MSGGKPTHSGDDCAFSLALAEIRIAVRIQLKYLLVREVFCCSFLPTIYEDELESSVMMSLAVLTMSPPMSIITLDQIISSLMRRQFPSFKAPSTMTPSAH